ncbi:MAG: M20 family metallopeptidase [Chloroflexota bacterium]|nr:M20 family metallopeptidase [Chloroflexota bacterium]
MNVDEAIDAVRDEALELSHRVHDTPEIAFQEHRAAAWTAELLERHGFDVVRGIGGLDTAIEARRRGTRPGPVVAFLGEYDALPEVGHGCGHNLMCSSSAAAAVAAADTVGADFAGEIRFVGTPAEEAGNGKIPLIEAGVFRDVDAALQFHPSDRTSSEIRCLALTEIGVAFHGVTAHASADPWLGRNALDALVTLYNSVAQWRQHLKPGERVHGIINHGGAAPNIVPDETAGRFYVRTPVDRDLDPMIERFHAMADAAAVSTGCTVTYVESSRNRCRTMLNNPTLLRLFRQHLAAAGWEDGPIDPNAGSTDMGNVSHELPTIHPMLAIAPEGTPGHSRQFSEYAAGPRGDEAMLVAARVLAATAVDLLRQPNLVAEAWAAFRSAEGCAGGPELGD